MRRSERIFSFFVFVWFSFFRSFVFFTYCIIIVYLQLSLYFSTKKLLSAGGYLLPSEVSCSYNATRSSRCVYISIVRTRVRGHTQDTQRFHHRIRAKTEKISRMKFRNLVTSSGGKAKPPTHKKRGQGLGAGREDAA